MTHWHRSGSSRRAFPSLYSLPLSKAVKLIFVVRFVLGREVLDEIDVFIAVEGGQHGFIGLLSVERSYGTALGLNEDLQSHSSLDRDCICVLARQS